MVAAAAIAPGRRVHEPLQRQRASLQHRPPRMVGEAPAVEPMLPVMRGPDLAPVGVLIGARRRMLAPRQRAEDRLALLHQVPRGRKRPLDAEVQIRHEAQLDVAAVGLDDRLVVVLSGVAPHAAHGAVVECRLALEAHLHLAVDAADRAQEHVVGVVVGRRAPMRVRALAGVVPRADQERVADDDPPASRVPARLEDHRARQVPPRGRNPDVQWTKPEHARRAIENRAEHARRVHPRQAQPLDVAARGDERGGLAVGKEGVVGDRGERAATAAAGDADAVKRHRRGLPIGFGQVANALWRVILPQRRGEHQPCKLPYDRVVSVH